MEGDALSAEDIIADNVSAVNREEGSAYPKGAESMLSPSPRASGYTPPAQPEFFVQAPLSVVRCPTLSPVAKTTYDVLLSYRDRHGLAYPGQARLAAEVGVSEPTLRRALARLAAEGLVEPTRRGQGHTNAYRVHRSELRAGSSEARPERKKRALQNENFVRSRTNKTFVELDQPERDPQEQDQPPPAPSGQGGEGGGGISFEQVQQIEADAALIEKATGMNTGEAAETAALAAASGHGPGYVAELVAHIAASPSVQNPAGCLRALVQHGKRRPARGAGGVPPRSQRAALHPEHYRPGGKYGHLFQAASSEQRAASNDVTPQTANRQPPILPAPWPSASLPPPPAVVESPSAPQAPPEPGAQILDLVRQQCAHWDHLPPDRDLLNATLLVWRGSRLDEAAFLAKLRVGMLRASVLTVPDGELRTDHWLRLVAAQTLPPVEARR